MQHVIRFLASGCFVGRLPIAPGTWGTGVGVLLYLAIRPLSAIPYAVTVVAFVFLAAWVATVAQGIIGEHDPPEIVIDEIAGFLVAMAFHRHEWSLVLCGFILFRVFDVVKPFPCGWLERHFLSGWGVVLDDVVAGIYANAVLWCIGLLLPTLGVKW